MALSPRDRRARRQAMYRRRRITVGLLAVTLVALVVVAVSGSGGKAGGRHADKSRLSSAPGNHTTASAPAAIPAVEAGLLPYTLPAPLSRMVVLPGGSGSVVVAGGLTAGQTSTAAIFALNTRNGSVTDVGSLARGVHDASGAVVAGSYVVFGGGGASTVATVQSLSPTSTGSPGTADASASLPAARSDSAAATGGSTSYVVGGYDGSSIEADVLATTDGRTFTTVATLPVPVRYPAVAATGGYIYVFGGEGIAPSTTAPDPPSSGSPTSPPPVAASSAQPGPVDVIQRIDPVSHRATIVGHLPYPLEAATAVNLDGQVYLAGGDSPSAAAPKPGVGTTQLDGWGISASQPDPGLTAVGDIWAFDPATATVRRAGELQVPVAHAAAAVTGGSAWLLGGETDSGVVATVQNLRANPHFGTAGQPGAGSPYFGDKLLIADRGNDRLLVMDPSMHITWSYPNATSPSDPLGFYFPDDAFFAEHGSLIISNQEQNETIVEIAYPSGRIVWSYGHPKIPGTAQGYLHEPDDAYLLRNGQITVADAQNCRVLVINPNLTVASQVGTNGNCVHSPPSSMGSPNGDTPLWDGNLLVSEINGSWVSEYTPTGRLVWTVQLPITYPSDPQQLGAAPGVNTDRYLIADYTQPGEVLQFTREGRIVTTYADQAGPGELNHPSLVELLPDGIYMINDDYNHRMVAIDPSDSAVVWQYGVTGQAGATPGHLNTPDGFDLLSPTGATPTHPQTG